MFVVTGHGGFGAGGGSSSAEYYSYQGGSLNTADASVYTFSDADFGVATANRLVIVGTVGSRTAEATASVSSITAGGVTLTNVVSRSYAVSNRRVLSIRAGVVSTGTTGDIVVTFNANCSYCGMVWWVANDLNSTTASDSGSASTYNTTGVSLSSVTIPSGGFGIFAGTLGNYSGWTNATALFTEMDTSGVYFSAADIFPGTGATPTVTLSKSGGTGYHGLVGASWS